MLSNRIRQKVTYFELSLSYIKNFVAVEFVFVLFGDCLIQQTFWHRQKKLAKSLFYCHHPSSRAEIARTPNSNKRLWKTGIRISMYSGRHNPSKGRERTRSDGKRVWVDEWKKESTNGILCQKARFSLSFRFYDSPTEKVTNGQSRDGFCSEQTTSASWLCLTGENKPHLQPARANCCTIGLGGLVNGLQSHLPAGPDHERVALVLSCYAVELRRAKLAAALSKAQDINSLQLLGDLELVRAIMVPLGDLHAQNTHARTHPPTHTHTRATFLSTISLLP